MRGAELRLARYHETEGGTLPPDFSPHWWLRVTLMIILAIAVVLALLACGQRPSFTGPTRPTPLPSARPSPSPTPPPTPPLSVSGHEFRDPEDRTVYLLGASGLGGDPVWNGWPLVSPVVVDDLAREGLNWTEVRVGPFSNGPEGDTFDWNHPTLFERAAESIRYANSKGVYVQVALFDHWCAQHGCSPFSMDDYTGDPSVQQVEWVQKVVTRLGRFPGVIWLDSNEAFKRPSMLWTTAIQQAVKDAERASGFPEHPFGTNSHDPRIERLVDYATWHQNQAKEWPGGYPLMVTEYDEDLAVERVIEAAYKQRDLEGSFHGNRGLLNDPEWRWLLRALGEARRGDLPRLRP